MYLQKQTLESVYDRKSPVSRMFSTCFGGLQLWDQDIAPLKKSLGTSSRRLSRISQLALVSFSSSTHPCDTPNF